ncbi:MAG TPA: substrate-binding domain-containing protein [Candidatus Limnocylindrales bacterium]
MATLARFVGGDGPCTVAVVITETTGRPFGHPYFAALLQEYNSALAEKSVVPVFLTPEDSHAEELVKTFLLSGKVDGVILISLKTDSYLPRHLIDRGIPVVIQGRPPEGVEASFVDVDNRQAGALATGHLIAEGRRRIAAIAGDLEMPSSLDRMLGYRDSLAAAGMPFDPTYVEVGKYQADLAYVAMERLLLSHPDLDGVFAASDLMAEAALRVLLQANRRIPEDVAVIGLDDLPMAWASSPPLSSVRQPIEKMTREAVNLVLGQILDAGQEPLGVVLAAELVTRESTIGAGDYN